MVAPGKAVAGPQGMEEQAGGGAPQPWSTSVVLSIVWATGFAGLIGLIVMRYRRLTRALGRADEVDEGPLRIAVEKLALRLGRGNPPPVLLSDAVTSPFLFGLVRPRIVLPANLPEALSADQLEDVLLHELIHWRRRDVAAGWLQIFVQALFWFHPLVWLAGAQLRHERECACDEAALESGCSQARRYGESLLSVLLAARGRSAVALGFLGIFERNTRLQRRLEEIMKQETKVRRLSVWGWLALALFAAACVPMASISPADSAKPAGDRIDWTSKLTENQLVFMQWTDRMFDRILDRRDFSAWKQADRDVLLNRCLRALGGPQNQEYLEAINTLGALGDRKAVKPLLAIATDRIGDDCRDNWMAARALGMIGDPSAIPDLIHLTYHTNLNTHLWAQISLVRMSGLNFGADYMKWGAWWNGRGGRPAFKPEKIRWWDDPVRPGQHDRGPGQNRHPGLHRQDQGAAAGGRFAIGRRRRAQGHLDHHVQGQGAVPARQCRRPARYVQRALPQRRPDASLQGRAAGRRMGRQNLRRDGRRPRRPRKDAWPEPKADRAGRGEGHSRIVRGAHGKPAAPVQVPAGRRGSSRRRRRSAPPASIRRRGRSP